MKITIRLIKSFEYRNFKNLIMEVSEQWTVSQLKMEIQKQIQTGEKYKIFQNMKLDTLKIFMKQHGAKTSNLIINLDKDGEWLMTDDSKTLKDYGIENEHEISFFQLTDYLAYKQHPDTKW